MKNIMYFVLVITCNCYADYVKVLLPNAKPRITISNGHGKDITPLAERRFDFANMLLELELDSSSKTGYKIPTSECDALEQFKKALPKDYFERLIKFDLGGLLESREVNDKHVGERLHDVNAFFLYIWMLRQDNKIYYQRDKSTNDFVWYLVDLENSKKCAFPPKQKNQ